MLQVGLLQWLHLHVDLTPILEVFGEVEAWRTGRLEKGPW